MRITSLAAAAALTTATAWPAWGHEVEQASGQLGKVNFANSCDAKVQKIGRAHV